MRYLGVFSSEKIEEWIEGQLKKLLDFRDTRPVQFKDLYIPLHVVATDLRGAKPIIWNSETTPDFSVARAVRCSCTIPIYFQPVDSTYVDGGLVSNLPSFVLNGRNAGQFEKLLCFTFSSDQVPQAPLYAGNRLLIENYVKSLISAFIDGAVHIQSELQPNQHLIEIGNLPLSTVDFEKVNKESVQLMLSAGRRAAKLFFDAEVTHIRSAGIHRPILHTETEALNHIVREELNNNDEVLIVVKSTRYVYNLFPTFLHWCKTGVSVTFACERAPVTGWDAEHEPFQRFVLKVLGARVIEVSSIPFEGVLFKKQENLEDMIIFDEHRKDEDRACFAVKYEKTFDAAAIVSMHECLSKCIPEISSPYKRGQSKVTIEKGQLDELIQRLKRVNQYGKRGVTLSLEEVDVNKIVFLTKYVKSYKYNQIHRLLDQFEKHDAEYFESMVVRVCFDERDIFMPITPPVVEEHGDSLYLFEGNSRLTYLIKEKRVQKVKLIVVRGVETPLPTTGRVNAKQLLITDEGRIGKDRYKGFDRTLFRKIEETVHSPGLYKEYFNV